MAINCNAKPVNFAESETPGHTLMCEEFFGFLDGGGFEHEEEELEEQGRRAVAASFQKAIHTNEPRLPVICSAPPAVKRGVVWKISDSSTLMVNTDSAAIAPTAATCAAQPGCGGSRVCGCDQEVSKHDDFEEAPGWACPQAQVSDQLHGRLSIHVRGATTITLRPPAGFREEV